MKNYIEELLATMGINNTGFAGLSSITPEQMASGLAGSYGIDPSLLPSNLFSRITPGLTAGAYGKTYSPLMQARQQPLLQDLMSTMGGKKSRQAFGGFAGSGQAQDFTAGVKDVYGKGMTDVLTDVSSSKAASEQSIIDLINSMKQTAQSIRFG